VKLPPWRLPVFFQDTEDGAEEDPFMEEEGELEENKTTLEDSGFCPRWSAVVGPDHRSTFPDQRFVVTSLA